MVKGVKWVSYDNEESVRKKTQFAFDEVRESPERNPDLYFIGS